jgi:hypothetical protein
MMTICLAKLQTADAQERLLTYWNEYTFDGLECAPLIYKIIMHLATINTVAITQTLRDNLQLLEVYVATVSGNINKVHNEFDKNYSQLIARGIVDDPIGILFEAYLVAPWHNFKSYIRRQHKDYLDGKLTAITHEALMTSAKCKFDRLKTKGLWGVNSPESKNIVVMTAAFNAIKGHLKLEPKLSTIAKEGKKRATTRTRRRRTRRICLTNVSRRRMRLGRKSCKRTVKSMISKLANTLTTGVSTTWRGPFTSLLTAS